MPEFLKLKKSNCKNCYKCIRHCPVKSIRFSANQAHIETDECILCGECFVVCPQNAKQIVDETEIADVLLKGTDPVAASIAPSFAAYFEGVGIESLSAALKKLGFTYVEETALGATLVKREYERIAAGGEQDIIITSCCHTVNLLVEKYYPSLAGYLAPVVTPMQAHALDLKRRYPGVRTVFFGPCLSKKDEAYRDGIDAALTFDELSAMFAKAGITPEKLRGENPDSRARLFPTTGGILRTMTSFNPDYTYFSVDGTENCQNVLSDIAAGNIHRCFIEMSSCTGSCIGGPIMAKYRNSPVRHYMSVNSYAGKEDFDIVQPAPEQLLQSYAGTGLNTEYPSETELNEILRRMGKNTPEDELNCGTCGYDTCRKKAVAIYQGKAEISMCLPYLMEKSERFSNSILDNSPNGIIVVNSAFEVQQINRAAMQMLRVNSASDILGDQLIRIMDPTPFMDVSLDKKQVRNRLEYYAEYDKYLELTIVSDRISGDLIAIIRDVTDGEKAKTEKADMSRQTAEVADKVVDKQMRIVQEIASLLGETAAETKIALTKLKESMTDDEND